MNSPLKEFFNREKDRFLTPGPYFTKRVMERVRDRDAAGGFQYGIWDMIADVTRPVFAAALVVILGLIALEAFIPAIPERGMVEALLEADQGPGERLLYSDAEFPNNEELFVEMMGLGEQ
jgi:hypothetical protein